MTTGIEAGTQVRYPRTGTNGNVVRVVKQGGFFFAELDTTGLLYRLDQLVITEFDKKIIKDKSRDEDLSDLRHEKELLEEGNVNDTTSLDGACSGAG